MRPALLLPLAAWLVLVGLLSLAAATPGHFGDPAAPYRLVAYPVLALLLPGLHLLARTGRPVPVAATTLVTAPFLLDTIGNLGDLYARISWWDDANHVGNWLLLGAGVGLALAPVVRPAWALGLLVVGLGAALAVLWEVGEWAFFYTEPYPATLYADTVADLVLGCAGATVAAVLVAAAAGRTGRTGRTRPPVG